MNKVKVGDLVYEYGTDDTDNGRLVEVNKVTAKYIHVSNSFRTYNLEGVCADRTGIVTTMRIKTLDELPDNLVKVMKHRYNSTMLNRMRWYDLDPKLVEQVIRLCEGWSKTRVLYGNALSEDFHE